MRRSVGRRAPGVALALLIITMSAPVLGVRRLTDSEYPALDAGDALLKEAQDKNMGGYHPSAAKAGAAAGRAFEEAAIGAAASGDCETAYVAATRARAAVDPASKGGGSAPDQDKQADQDASDAAAFAAGTAVAANSGPCDPKERAKQEGKTASGSSSKNSSNSNNNDGGTNPSGNGVGSSSDSDGVGGNSSSGIVGTDDRSGEYGSPGSITSSSGNDGSASSASGNIDGDNSTSDSSASTQAPLG